MGRSIGGSSLVGDSRLVVVENSLLLRIRDGILGGFGVFEWSWCEVEALQLWGDARAAQ